MKRTKTHSKIQACGKVIDNNGYGKNYLKPQNKTY